MNPITIMFVLVASALIFPGIFMMMHSQVTQTQAAAAAVQMVRVQKAAEGYIQTYAAAVDAGSSPTSPYIITVPQLINTGFLPNGFSAINPYGQTWQVQVLQPSPNQLQALVLSTGGQTLTADQAGSAAEMAGGAGGVTGGTTPGCQSGSACGVYTGWNVSTQGYQNVAPGHLSALIAFSGGQLQSDYLYRNAVPGQPQLNTMNTNLNMGANSVNNADEINAQSETLAGGEPNGQAGSLQIGSNYYYGDSSNAAVRTPGGFYVQNQNASGPASIDEVNNIQASGNITTPDTVQGGYVNSTGDVNAQYDSTASNAFAINDGSWWANNAGDSSQSGNAYVGGQIEANYDATLGTAGGGANVGWGCSPNGSIAANANGSGQLLACVNGSWQSALTSTENLQSYSFGNGFCNAVNCPYYPVTVGWHKYCSISGYGQYNNAYVSVYPVAGPNYQGQYQWDVQSLSGNINGLTVTCD